MLGLDPAECVFVDDIQVNVAAAEAVGMTAILHTDPATTLSRLGGLLGFPLTGPGGPAPLTGPGSPADRQPPLRLTG